MVEKPDPLPWAEDARFMLGEINANVKHTAAAVSDLRVEMMANLSGFNQRLQELERAFAQRTGSRTTLIAVVSGLSALVTSMLSGLAAYFMGLGRH